MRRMWVLATVLAVALVLLFTAARAVGGEDPVGKPEEPKAAGVKVAEETEIAVPRATFDVGTAWKELKRYYKAGGGTMHAILFLSIFALAFVLERIFRLRRAAVAPAGLAAEANRLWKAGDMDKLQALAQRYRRSTLGKVILFVLEYRQSALADINTAAGDIAARDKSRHMMLTYPIGVAAVLAPLLGLFGTVVGMVEAFEIVALAGAMGDPSLLSSSISKALLTTVFGLVVAMPGVFMYNVFKLRTNYLFSELEEEASELINSWLMKKGNANARQVG